MTPEEMLLYFFLVLVEDRNGVSFYGYERICALLKLPLDAFIEARDRLVSKSLIAVQSGRFQVLDLPQKPSVSDSGAKAVTRKSGIQSLAEIFTEMAQPKP